MSTCWSTIAMGMHVKAELMRMKVCQDNQNVIRHDKQTNIISTHQYIIYESLDNSREII